MKLGLSVCGYSLFLCAAVAGAEPTGAQGTLATQLFDDAEKLSASRNFRDACPKYAESMRLDPQLGTLLHLADCHEKTGKTASAWTRFKEAIELAARRGDSRESTARARALALEPKLSRLEVIVPADAPPGIEVRQDGDVIGRPVWGSAVPVDPGPHEISVRASGYKAWKTSVQVSAEGSRVRVAVPQLEADHAQSQLAAAPGTPDRSESRNDAEVESGVSSQRILGFAVGGAGLVAASVGVAFLARRGSKISERDAIPCEAGMCTVETKQRIDQLSDEARGASTTGGVLIVAGSAAVIGGAILILTAPSRSSSPSAVTLQPWLGLRSAGATAAFNW